MLRGVWTILIVFFSFLSFAQRGYIIENKGQLPDNVLFHIPLNYGDVYIEKEGLKVKVLSPFELDNVLSNHAHEPQIQNHKLLHTESNEISGHVFNVNFLGADLSGEFQKNKILSHKINYFWGNTRATNIQPFQELIINDIYYQTDFRLYFKGDAIKYEFILREGANHNQIKVEYDHLNDVDIQKNKITLKTSVGNVYDEDPISYCPQNHNLEIPTVFNKINNKTIDFKLDTSKISYPLVIDPQLIFATFTGARYDNWGYTATYDDLGYGYAGGIDFFGTYITTTGAFQTNYGGGQIDVAISKFTPDGSEMVYSTYIGGDALEAPHSMVVNSKGELVIYGVTSSTNFPVSTNAYDNAFNGGTAVGASNVLKFDNGTDIFISKLNFDGSQLLGSTFYGGSGNDALNDANQNSFLYKNYADVYRGEVTVDKNDNIFISSVTSSIDLPIVNGFQPTFGGGNQDGCLAKFTDDLSNIIWSSYFGGTGDDACYASKQNQTDETYFTGGTTSNNINTSSNSLIPNYQDNIDGYVARVSSDGTTLLNCSYLGTSEYDQSYLVDVDNDGFVYCFGQTFGNMPVSDSVFKIDNSTQFLMKLNPTLSAIEKSTLIGNGIKELNLVPSALMVSDCKEIYLSGWGGQANDTLGTTNGLPTTSDAYIKTTDGSDFYFMVLEPDFEKLKYATFFGGSTLREHVDGGTSRFDRSGTIYQAVCGGCGASSAFPVTPNAFSTENPSLNCNLALIKMDISKLNANLQFTNDSSYCEDRPITFYNESTGGKEYEWIYPDGSTSNSYNGSFVFPDSGIYTIKLVAIDSAQCPYRDTAEMDVAVIMFPEITFDIDTFLCNDSEIEISTIGGPNDSNYTWYANNKLIDGQTPLIKYLVDSTTTFDVEYTNICGTREESITIPFYYPPISISQKDTFCEYEDQKFYFPIEDNYEVSEINNKPFVLFNDSILFGQSSNTYIINVENFCGSALDTFEVQEIIIVPEVSPDTIVCPGDYVNIYAKGGDNYIWEGETINDSSQANQNIQIWESTTFPVTVYKNGCAKTDSVEITVFPKPKQNILDDYTIHFGDEITLSLNENFRYVWSPRDFLSNPNSHITTTKPDDDITYYYTYDSDENCKITDSVKIKVIFPIYVPNTFTPNGDGRNEKFYVYSHVLDEFEFYIYNRWGNLIFETTNLSEGWDGTFKGNPQQEDVYVYKLRYVLRYTGRWREKVGTINLIR